MEMLKNGAGISMDHYQQQIKLIIPEQSLAVTVCGAAGLGQIRYDSFIQVDGHMATLPTAGTTLSASVLCAPEFCEPKIRAVS